MPEARVVENFVPVLTVPIRAPNSKRFRLHVQNSAGPSENSAISICMCLSRINPYNSVTLLLNFATNIVIQLGN
jgi:hypothetical protein